MKHKKITLSKNKTFINLDPEKSYKMIKVTLLDTMEHSQKDINERDIKSAKVYCFGFLIKETSQNVLVADWIDFESNTADVHAIPKCTILKIVELKETKKVM